ncbi:DNA replication/repair protein RecF [Novispirillum sp. DQ9]|uniref:DNA replication/repair protein RecF n=1 Tax=Novispirillum sp. DQ9 TaxID=3398612 RepID=UPI003C7B9C42
MTDSPAPFTPVGVRRLTLTDFRSYASLRVETDLRPVVLTGANGAGKTNLLEAVSFLTPGRGLRRARLSEITRFGAPGGARGAWAVAALVDSAHGPIDIGTGRQPGESDRRVVRLNGQPARSQSDLGEFVSAVWLTPAMDGLFRDAASGRRRFLDRLVYGLDTGHASRLSAYEQATRERSRLLRDGVTDRAWLAALEDAMATHGVAVAAARRDLVGRLGRALEAAEGPFPRAVLALDGLVEGWLADRPALEAEEAFRKRLADDRPKERAGAPAEGPHRTDLAVTHAARGMAAEHCSTGEQKALLIAVLLAQARVQGTQRGAAPLLLLDEVAAHLDGVRREALYDALAGIGAQAWLTGTDRALFESFGDRAQFFDVRDGGLHAC